MSVTVAASAQRKREKASWLLKQYSRAKPPVCSSSCSLTCPRSTRQSATGERSEAAGAAAGAAPSTSDGVAAGGTASVSRAKKPRLMSSLQNSAVVCADEVRKAYLPLRCDSLLRGRQTPCKMYSPPAHKSSATPVCITTSEKKATSLALTLADIAARLHSSGCSARSSNIGLLEHLPATRGSPGGTTTAGARAADGGARRHQLMRPAGVGTALRCVDVRARAAASSSHVFTLRSVR